MSQFRTSTITKFSTFPCNPTSELPNSLVIPNSEVEPDIDVGPNPVRKDRPLVAVVYQQDRYSRLGGGNANYLKYSVDGGKTFSCPIPLPTVQCFGGPFERDTDPRVAIDCKGTIYFAGLPFNAIGPESNVAVGKFDVKKGGFKCVTYLDQESFTNPLPSTTDYEDIITDGTDVYVSWHVYFYPEDDFTNEIRFSRSHDGCNYTSPVVVTSGSGDALPQGFTMALLDNPCRKFSKIVAAYGVLVGADILPREEQSVKYFAAISEDQGETWLTGIPLADQSQTVIGFAVDPNNQDQVIRSGESLPNITTDRKRNIVYVATQENSLIINGVPSAIFIYFSLDGGLTWTKSGPVNRVPSVQAFTPSISVDENGDISIGYYDFRNYLGTTVTDPLLTDRWLDRYHLNKRTRQLQFIEEFRLTCESFDLRRAPTLIGSDAISPPGKFLGDYVGQVNYQGRTYTAYPIVPEIYFNNPADINLSIIKQDDC